MAAFFLIQVTLKDRELFQEYAVKAKDVIAAFNGRILARGICEETLRGDMFTHNISAVIQFPDMETLKSFYHSDEYKAIITLREKAADMVFTAYQVPEG